MTPAEALKRILAAYAGCKARGMPVPTILEAAIVLAKANHASE